MSCSAQTGFHSEMLLDYCAGRLPAEVTRSVQEHLSVCEHCSAFVLDQRKVWDALDDWAAEPVSTDFDARLMARARAEEQGGVLSWLRSLAVARRPMLATATAVAAAVTLLVWLAPDPGEEHAGKERVMAPAAVEAQLEPEQVERVIEDIEMLREFSIPAHKDQSI